MDKYLNFRREVHVIYANFSEDFDSVNQIIFPSKLATLNITLSVNTWCAFYPFNQPEFLFMVAHDIIYTLPPLYHKESFCLNYHFYSSLPSFRLQLLYADGLKLISSVASPTNHVLL